MSLLNINSNVQSSSTALRKSCTVFIWVVLCTSQTLTAVSSATSTAWIKVLSTSSYKISKLNDTNCIY